MKSLHGYLRLFENHGKNPTFHGDCTELAHMPKSDCEMPKSDCESLYDLNESVLTAHTTKLTNGPIQTS
jgi:hypothetical protein